MAASRARLCSRCSPLISATRSSAVCSASASARCSHSLESSRSNHAKASCKDMHLRRPLISIARGNTLWRSIQRCMFAGMAISFMAHSETICALSFSLQATMRVLPLPTHSLKSNNASAKWGASSSMRVVIPVSRRTLPLTDVAISGLTKHLNSSNIRPSGLTRTAPISITSYTWRTPCFRALRIEGVNSKSTTMF